MVVGAEGTVRPTQVDVVSIVGLAMSLLAGGCRAWCRGVPAFVEGVR